MKVAASKFKWRRALGLVALVLAVGISAIIATNYWKTRPLSFDRAAWDAATPGIDDFRRHRMADWLIRERRLIGMSRAEVISLLGKPTTTGHFRNYDLVYVLGNERGWISIDSEWLLMRLDSAGRVSAAELATD